MDKEVARKDGICEASLLADKILQRMRKLRHRKKKSEKIAGLSESG